MITKYLSWPNLEIRGIARLADEPRALVIYFDREPSDSELINTHIHLKGFAPSQTRPQGWEPSDKTAGNWDLNKKKSEEDKDEDMSEYYRHCEYCYTLRDENFNTDVFPRELMDIRGEVKWRHKHKRDQMFTTTCKNQLLEEPSDKIQELAKKYVIVSKCGKQWIVSLNGHIVYRGKNESGAIAVAEMCYKPDVIKIAKEAIAIAYNEQRSQGKSDPTPATSGATETTETSGARKQES